MRLDLKQVSFEITLYEAESLKMAAERNRDQRKRHIPALTRALKKLDIQIDAAGGRTGISVIMSAVQAEALQINAGNYGNERLKTLSRAINKIHLARWRVGITESCGAKRVLE